MDRSTSLIRFVLLATFAVAVNSFVLQKETPPRRQNQSNSSQTLLANRTSTVTSTENTALPVLSGKIESASLYDARSEPALAWKCPEVEHIDRELECTCDIPHTLRCSGNIHGLELLAVGLRNSPYPVSLLDCTLINVTFLSDAKIFEGISGLSGLVISSGEIKRVHRLAFVGMTNDLEALGLPNNKLSNVPAPSIAPLTQLDRLDLSNNQIKALTSTDFATLGQLTYLELSDNKITSISPRAFANSKLQYLKLKGNRLGEFPTSLQSLMYCKNLTDLDLRSNSLRGPLTRQLIPKLPQLETLNLDKNLLTSVQNEALEKFGNLKSLSMRHNQIDVLQDHAFKGLSRLQVLDLAHNGIVAISGASLQHLPKLVLLDLTHNFLRALTQDMVFPLPSISEIKLDGNDITLIAENAVDKLQLNQSLSLRDNPLNCDCNLRPFATWLANISNSEGVGAVCATPPQLEGAPVISLTLENLTCDDTASVTMELNSEALDQIESVSNSTNISAMREVSDKVTLKKVDLTADYSLYLHWKINLDHYYCDFLFIYRETMTSEILIDHVPVQCQDTSSEQENIIVHLADSSALTAGENYRFCLVLLEEVHSDAESVVGCSNFTKLHITTVPVASVTMYNVPLMAENVQDSSSTTSIRAIENQTADLINKSIGLFIGLLLLGIAIAVLLWRIAKIKKYLRHASPAPLNYICDDSPRTKSSECTNNNRYYKLQATTSL